MTCFGMYSRQTVGMFNIELARIIQADREREIEAALRVRRMLRPAEKDAVLAASRSMCTTQRPASTGALSR
jgi:hypothetical protein